MWRVVRKGADNIIQRWIFSSKNVGWLFDGNFLFITKKTVNGDLM